MFPRKLSFDKNFSQHFFTNPRSHITNFIIASLFFPIHRTGIAATLLSLSFDKTLVYHRILGVCFFVSSSIHYFCWVMDWIRKGTLFHNLYSILNYPHEDNWSIPMIEIAFWGGVVMFILAQNYFRRNKFEWFYYSHHWYTVIVLSTLIHAWTLWYYLGKKESF